MIIDLSQLRGYAGGLVGAVAGTSSQFSGAHVSHIGIGDQTILNGASAQVQFGTEIYDVGGWFDPASNSILTVPSGVTRVRAFWSCRIEGIFSASNQVRVEVIKNGLAFTGSAPAQYKLAPGSFGEPCWNGTTLPFDVVAGDTLAVLVTALSIAPSLSLIIPGSPFFPNGSAFLAEAVF